LLAAYNGLGTVGTAPADQALETPVTTPSMVLVVDSWYDDQGVID
jgi:hypothetical protein